MALVRRLIIYLGIHPFLASVLWNTPIQAFRQYQVISLHEFTAYVLMTTEIFCKLSVYVSIARPWSKELLDRVGMTLKNTTKV